MNIRAQKIDGTMLNTYRIVVAAFSVTDKANPVKFFKETFFVANVKPEIVFRILFLILSNIEIDISAWELRWRIYITKSALPTTKYVKLVV